MGEFKDINFDMSGVKPEDLEVFGKFSEALTRYVNSRGPVIIGSDEVSPVYKTNYIYNMDPELKTPEVYEMFHITRRMVELYASKNRDYGNTFDKTLDEDGLVVAKIRLSDKLGRFGQLIKKEASVSNETILDTLIDLANYAAMTIRWIEGRENDK